MLLALEIACVQPQTIELRVRRDLHKLFTSITQT